MNVIVYKWISVIFLSMFKFIAGPILGVSLGLSLVETTCLTVVGMMTSVLIFSTLGTWIRGQLANYYKKKSPVFSKKTRRVVSVWNKFGILGVSFLTPMIFTPIGGTMILVSFRQNVYKIWLYMLTNAVLWAVLVNFFLHFIGLQFWYKMLDFIFY
jgi:uncharacterized membrane protein